MALVKLNNRGVRSATTFGSISALGEMRFIKKQTASASSTIDFVDGTSDVVLDDTYKEYFFTFKNIHPSDDAGTFTVNFRDGGSAYDATKTSTAFNAYHKEDGSAATVGYDAGSDLAQGTGDQYIAWNLGNENDENVSGYLHLFNPSSTTFVKHFISSVNHNNNNSYANNQYIAGYCNVTVAIDGVQFKMASGNIDAGTIKLYGIKDS